jgi:hypothetical protein
VAGATRPCFHCGTRVACPDPHCDPWADKICPTVEGVLRWPLVLGLQGAELRRLSSAYGTCEHIVLPRRAVDMHGRMWAAVDWAQWLASNIILRCSRPCWLLRLLPLCATTCFSATHIAERGSVAGGAPARVVVGGSSMLPRGFSMCCPALQWTPCGEVPTVLDTEQGAVICRELLKGMHTVSSVRPRDSRDPVGSSGYQS